MPILKYMIITNDLYINGGDQLFRQAIQELKYFFSF